MRLLLGQLYDQRTAAQLESFYVGEVLIPQERLNPLYLREAVCFILHKYPVLRASFTRNEGEWNMHFLAPDQLPGEVAFSVLDEAAGLSIDARLQAGIDALLASPSMTPPLIRYVLLDAEQAERQRLLVIFHHLVCDGISSRILWRDISRAYRAAAQGEPLPTETCDSYPAFAQELAERYRALPAATQPSPEPLAALGTLDRVAHELSGKTLASTQTCHCLHLQAAELQALRACAAAWQLSLSDCLLGCWLHALSSVQAQGSVDLMMWVSPHFIGDWHTPVAELVGSVSFPLPVRVNLQAGEGPREAAHAAVAQVQQAMASAQDFAIRHFSGVPGAPVPPLAAIGFNFISSPRPNANLIGYQLAPEPLRLASAEQQMAHLPLSFEAEIHAHTLRITVLVSPQMTHRLALDAVIDRLFGHVQSMATTCN
ncbi:condensation domain-containing protein [Pseudomonas sp. NPDC089554]|uniref:condensation domain-containing protein n=1 Tax=Pseudomonas sp. NPDC089554 TaxID=3390653 RepID=UPI003D08F86B